MQNKQITFWNDDKFFYFHFGSIVLWNRRNLIRVQWMRHDNHLTAFDGMCSSTASHPCRNGKARTIGHLHISLNNSQVEKVMRRKIKAIINSETFENSVWKNKTKPNKQILGIFFICLQILGTNKCIIRLKGGCIQMCLCVVVFLWTCITLGVLLRTASCSNSDQHENQTEKNI